MKDTRLSGKIVRNDEFIWRDFLIECLWWVPLFAVTGYFLDEIFIGYFRCIEVNVIAGCGAGVLDAYAHVRWDFPYFSNILVHGGVFIAFLYLCMYCGV